MWLLSFWNMKDYVLHWFLIYFCLKNKLKIEEK